jgi:hypothetical protein
MTSLQTAIQDTIVQDITPGIDTALIELDPTFAEVIQDKISAYRDGHMGRAWQVKHVFSTGVAGTIKAEANMNGDNLGYAGDVANIWGNAGVTNLSTWQNISEGVSPGFTTRTVTLKRWKGNIFLPLDVLRSDALDASVGSVVAETIKGTAQNIGHAKANMFFAPEGTHKYYGKVGVLDADGDVDDTDATITLAADSRIRRFQPGMLVEVLDATDTYSSINSATDPRVIVTYVDPINSQIKLSHVGQGTEYWEALIAAGDIIVLYNSHSETATGGYGPSGLETWIQLKTATDVFGLDFTKFPQFGSDINDAGSTPSLTDELLRKYVGRFLDSHSRSQWPDTLLTTSGVLADYISSTDSLKTYEVQGRKSIAMKGGFSKGTGFEYNGHVLLFQSGPLIPGGTLYGLKLQNNIVRYTPPQLPGAGSMDQFRNGSVEFVGPVLGSKGIWLPCRVDDDIAPYMQAPFEICEEYAPKVIPAIKLYDLAEWSVT